MLGLRERFKKICEEKGIKPFSLASKNVNRNIIDSIMRGSDIAVSSAYEIAKALDITIEELLTGEEPQVKAPIADYGYTDKFTTILKSGNETAIGIVKGTIDTAYNQIEAVKKTKAMAS